MGKIRGAKEYERWQRKERLSYKQAILANCYSCNGKTEGGDDCLGDKSCPLYCFFPYNANGGKVKSNLTLEERAEIGERLKKGKQGL